MWFEWDLKKGNETEREFAGLLVRKETVMALEFAPKGRFKDWDIKARIVKNWKESIVTFEVKDDMKSSETWNVWFEYWCYNSPSWIYSTKADYIVYRIDGKFYLAERWKLLTMLNFIEKSNVTWWDFNWAHMFIVSKRHLNELFKVL